jgi:hypothetical protein
MTLHENGPRPDCWRYIVEVEDRRVAVSLVPIVS